MLAHLRPTLVLLALATALLGIAFPLAFVGLGQVAFPFQAGGSMVAVGGKPAGSALIGQNFTSPRYFHSRPSALTGTDPKDPSKTVPTPYDASESGASNLGPAAQGPARPRARRHQGGRQRLRPRPGRCGHQLRLRPRPRHLARQRRAPGGARRRAARHIPPAQVETLVASQTQGRWLGILGEPRLNVLALNMALDAAH